MTHPFDKHYINGEWTASTSTETIGVENPATLDIFARIPDGTPADAEKAILAAKAAQPAWSRLALPIRILLMKEMLRHFEAMRDEIVEWEVKELGSPVTFTTSAHCDYQMTRIRSYIEAVETIKFEEAYAASTVRREPVGVVACITPWNYPLGQIVQKVVPAILMGNTVVLKPSRHTPLTAVLMAEAFDRAGFPKGVFNLVSGSGSRLGEILSTHPKVDMVSFTGSTRVGCDLARRALLSMKRFSLELGGKSPFILLKSDDYRPAMARLIPSIFYNAGQTCTALSRLLVPVEDLDKVKVLLKETVENIKTGDPTDPAVEVGPLSSKAQFEKVRDYLLLGLAEGAELLTGRIPAPDEAKSGYFIEPAVFTNVTNDMRIAREEIFGPVLCVLTYRDVDEAVRIANDTPYGLNAAVFGPKEAAVEVAKRLEAGNVYVNDAPRDVTAPFGGYKSSGIGREGGVAGLLEFSQMKAIFDHGN